MVSKPSKNSTRLQVLSTRFVYLFIAVLFMLPFDAQVAYKTTAGYLKSKHEQNNLLAPFQNNYPDTSIYQLNEFAPRNFMGNIGMASPACFLNYGTENLGFRVFNQPLLADRFVESQVDYYRSDGPFARLDGIAGQKQLQMFKLFFTHTYKQKINITLRLNRNTSLGFYKKQQTFTNNFYLSSNYTAKRNRYGYYAYILNNGNRSQENGGLSDVTLNDSTASLNKELLKVKLDSSSRDNREIRFMLNPWLKLNSAGDSLSSLNHFLQLKTVFSNSSYKVKSGDGIADKFYKDYFYDSINAVDSSHFRQLTNNIEYTVKSSNNRLALSTGYKHELNRFWQRSKDSLFANQLITMNLFLGNLNRNPEDTLKNRAISNNLNFQYVLRGPNHSNYKIENNFVVLLNHYKNNFLYFDFTAEKRSPDYIFNTWNSNHFKWANNGFKAQSTVDTRAGINLARLLNVNLFYQNFFGLLYFNTNAQPSQYNRTIQNAGASVSVTKIFLKHIGLGLKHIYQQSSNTSYIRIPQNVTSARLFYNGLLFKNNLQLQLGSQVEIFQSFRGYNYSPSTQIFYLQDNQTTAAMPFLDFYLHARVRPVTVFVKIENVLAGTSGINYSFVPGYYQPERALRFGITWVFFD